MIRICTAHPLFHLVHSNFFIRAIVKGHPLNAFDVLFFDSIIAKLARAPSCPYRRKYTELRYKTARRSGAPNAGCYFYRPWYVFIFHPRFTNFIPYSRIPFPLPTLSPHPFDAPLAADYFSKFSTTLFKIS